MRRLSLDWDGGGAGCRPVPFATVGGIAFRREIGPRPRIALGPAPHMHFGSDCQFDDEPSVVQGLTYAWEVLVRLRVPVPESTVEDVTTEVDWFNAGWAA